MDRQEYREIISEIRNSYKRKDYERVIMFARELPVKKIKENNILEMLATAYDQVGKTSLARTTLEIAYRRMPNGKQTAYKMAVLSLKLNDIESAVQYYEEFCKIAPNDNKKYILKYEIATAGGLSLYDRIRILEDYTEKETDDKWMYELARLYHEAGMADKCVQMCDDIVVWFSDGEYLKRALELKFAHKALSPTQQAMYERIMQDYIEDYEEPEPEQEKNYEEFEEDAEQFANDFLGVDPAAGAMDGNTKPVNVPAEMLEQAEAEEAADAEAEADAKPAQEKRNISLTTTKGESAEHLAAEIASSIAKNGVATPRQDRKNIFYDFKLELSQPLKPIRKPEPVPAAAPEKEEPAIPEPVQEEAPVPAEEPAPAPVKEVISEEAEAISERLFAGEEKLPELVPEPEEMAYMPETEVLPELPEPDEMFEKKQFTVNEGQVDLNLDLLGGEEKEVEGQLSIDQLFKTYASNLTHNIENKEAVARVEAERLKQIREAVESSRPSLRLDDFDEDRQPGGNEPAAGRAVKVSVEEDTVTFRRDPAFQEEAEKESENIKDTVIFHKEDIAIAEEGELKLPAEEPAAAVAEEPAEEPAEPVEGDVFRIEDEPELAYEDPVDKLFREFEEQERAKEEARKAEIRALEEATASTQKKEIEIPAFLRDITFAEPEEDELEADLALLEESEEEPVPEAEPEEVPEPAATEPAGPSKTEDDLFDEIMAEVEEVQASKPVKTEEEIEEELDELGDFLAESMGTDVTETAEEATAEDPEIEEILKEKGTAEKLVLTEDQEMELDDLGDALADIFGDEEAEEEHAEEVPAEETAEEISVEEVVEEAAEEEAIEEIPAEEVIEDVTAEEITEEIPAEEVIEEVSAEEITEEIPAEEAAEEISEEELPEETAEGAPAEEETAEEAPVEEEPAEEETAEETAEEEATEEAAEELPEEEPAEEEPAEGEPAEEEPEEILEEEASEELLAEETAEEETEEIPEEAVEETAEEEPEELPEEEYEEEELPEEEEVYEEPEEAPAAMDEADLEALIDEAEEEPEEETEYEEEYEEQEEEAEEAEEEELEPKYEVIEESVSGDTQPIERIHNFVMPYEMKEELAEFLLIDGMDAVITNTINNIILTKRSGDPTGGHLIITGDKKIGKTFLTISMIKAVNNELNSGSGKVAKVQSDSLNGKDVAKVFHKIAGNDLIIENVGDLEEQTIREILDVMTYDETVQNMVVFEGNTLAIETIINHHPEVKQLFKNRVDVSELTISQWADVACDYAKRKGYRVGDMALLALHAKIDEINVPTSRFGYEDIVNIMETAIERCEKRNTGKLFSAFSKKEGEEIELNESDFI